MQMQEQADSKHTKQALIKADYKSKKNSRKTNSETSNKKLANEGNDGTVNNP